MPAVAVIGAMPVAARDDRGVVVAMLVGERRDRGGDRRAALDGQAAALAEVVLHVDDEQCAGHRVWRRAGSRPRGCRGRGCCGCGGIGSVSSRPADSSTALP